MFNLKIHSFHSSAAPDISTPLEVDEECLRDDKPPLDVVHFSSGNPLVETCSGVVHLFRDVNEKPGTLARLPTGRSEDLCLLAVPNHMTGSDLCNFTGSFLANIRAIRIVRNDAVEERYMVLLKMDSQASADDFYRYFNGKEFSSLEPDMKCLVVFSSEVHFTDVEEEAATAPDGLTELPTCTFCLERLDDHISGILTSVCNHSFHSSCISKWEDASCPVCRYCSERPARSSCSVCGTGENLWMCLICGFIGCGRYAAGDAVSHWQSSGHCYSLDLESEGSQQVWDYAGDNYVHRLIHNKTDGKLVAIPHPKTMGGGTSGDPDFEEAVINSKVGKVAEEFNHLLCSQLDNQREYFEGVIAGLKGERESAIAAAVEKGVSGRLQKMQTRMDKASKEREQAGREADRLRRVDKEYGDAMQLNAAISENLRERTKKLREQEAREAAAVAERDASIRDLEEQVRDFMIDLEARATFEQQGSAELREGTILSVGGAPAPPPPAAPPQQGRSGRGARNGRRGK